MLFDDITCKYSMVSYSLNNHILSCVFNSQGMEWKPETKRSNFEGMAMWEHTKDNKLKFFLVMSISQTKLTRIMSSFYLFMKEKFCNQKIILFSLHEDFLVISITLFCSEQFKVQ